MIQIVRADGSAEQAVIAGMKARSAAKNADIQRAAAAILEDVRQRGYAAVEEYSLRFDKAAPREISREELDAAYARCPADLIAALETAFQAVRNGER